MKGLRFWLLSAWMYLGGPLAWCLWISWRLAIYTPEEMVAFLLPRGLIIMVLFLGLHLMNTRSLHTGTTSARPGHLVDRHFGLLGVFASLGTFLFLVPLSPGDLSWAPRTVRASMAGISLVGLLYPLCTVQVLMKAAREPAAARRIRLLNRVSWWIGCAAFTGSALLPPWPEGLDPLKAVSLLLPLGMSCLMLRKAEKELGRAS